MVPTVRVMSHKKTLDTISRRGSEGPMARIPDDEIQRLKREVSLERLVEARASSSAPRRRTSSAGARSTTTARPSLVVTPAKNLWHCLGACQQGGLGDRLGDEVARRELPPRGRDAARATPGAHERPPCATRPDPVPTNADDRELLDQVVAYYHETLKQSPEALDYLEARGLSTPS